MAGPRHDRAVTCPRHDRAVTCQRRDRAVTYPSPAAREAARYQSAENRKRALICFNLFRNSVNGGPNRAPESRGT
jgi:hypothetical protein